MRNFKQHNLTLNKANLTHKESSISFIIAIFLVISGQLWSALVHAELPVSFRNAAINMPPPGAKVTAGYFTIDNQSTNDVSIVSAASDAFEKIEFHLSTIENDVAKMRKADSLDIRAGESLQLAHGGMHLMLMGIKQQMDVKTPIEITLTTANEQTLTVEMKVMMPGSKMQHAEQQDSKMPMDGTHMKEMHDKSTKQ